MLTYILVNWQPLIGLITSSVVLVSVGYIQWFGETRPNVVYWIAKYIFRDRYGAVQNADSLFMVATSFIISMAGVWLILAVYFLAD
jgi:hypothetical protein